MSPPRYESKAADPSPLGQPIHFTFANVTAPNRFLKGAMTERISSWHPTDFPKRGIPSKELINMYRHFGQGGIGNILTGNIMLDYDQLEAPGNMIIPRSATFEGERFEAFKQIATEAKKGGSLIVGQVSHPGRQVQDRIQKDPVSASDVQLEGVVFGLTFAKPHAATQEEIDAIVDAFAHSAEFLDKAGYSGIELHGAHGYLLAQFLSERTNQRTDKYGGSLTNRSRIIVEIAHAIRNRVSPSFILGIKLNSVEFQDRGFQPEEARELCKILEDNRFDFVELSGGTYEENHFVHKRESSKKREAFFMEFADLITPALKETKAYVTGGFRSVGGMIDALKTVDGIGLGRPLAAEPSLAKHIIEGKVTGAIKNVFDESDFILTNVLAGTQMEQISKDQQPLDASDPKVAEAFGKDLEVFMERLSKDVGVEVVGYVQLENVAVEPFKVE